LNILDRFLQPLRSPEEVAETPAPAGQPAKPIIVAPGAPIPVEPATAASQPEEVTAVVIPSYLTQDFFTRYGVPEADEETLRLFWAYIHDKQPGLVQQFGISLSAWKREKELAQETTWKMAHVIHIPVPKEKQ
jgi:hypothetical protein